MRKILFLIPFLFAIPCAAQVNVSGSQIQIGGVTGGVVSAQGTSPIQVNGVSGSPQAGDITVSCPTCGISQQMQITYQPPIAGQYIVMYPLACSVNSSTVAAGSCSTQSNAGSLAVSRWASGSLIVPTSVGATSTGWAYNGVAGLPSFVSAANVTAVYGVEWAYSTSTYGNLSNTIAGFGMGMPGHGGIGWTSYSVKVDGGSPTTFNFATTTATVYNSASGNVSNFNDLTTVYPALIVYFTGSAPPATSTVPVHAPFTFDASGLGLQWPFNYSGDTGASGSAYAISLPFLLKNVSGSVFNNISSGADVWFTPAHTNTVTNPTLNLNGYYPGIGTILGRGSGAIAVGDLVAGMDAHVEWGSDGNWHLQNPQTGGGGVTWPASGDIVASNGTSSPGGIAPVDGDCVVGSGGAWIAGSCSGSGSGLSGMTAGQVPIAATATTVTSSKALAGAGAGITTGPTTTTLNDCVKFGDTAGTLADTGAPCGSGGAGPTYQATGANIYAVNGGSLQYNAGGSYETDFINQQPCCGKLAAWNFYSEQTTYSALGTPVLTINGDSTWTYNGQSYMSLNNTATGLTNRKIYWYASRFGGGTVLGIDSTDVRRFILGGSGPEIDDSSQAFRCWLNGTDVRNASAPDICMFRSSAGIVGFNTTDSSTGFLGKLKAAHFLSSGASTITAGAGAGTTPTIAISGNDEGGQVTLTTGTTPTASAVVATITLANACPAAAYPTLSAAGANSAALTGTSNVWAVGATASTWTINAGSAALAASTAYTWNFTLSCN